MLNGLINKVVKRVVEGPPFDPSSLNDSVASKTQWSPINDSGANFKTHKLVNASPSRLEFQVTLGLKLFCILFIVVGCFITIYLFPINNLKIIEDTVTKDYISAGLGLLFSVAGSYLLYTQTIPIVFDTNDGYFWKGRISPIKVFDKGKLKCFCTLNDIYALQIISEFCSGNKSSYFSYELNIVLKDGNRINVVDHGNKIAILNDANTLRQFLDKPLWNAT